MTPRFLHLPPSLFVTGAALILSFFALGVGASPGEDFTLQQTYQAAKAGEIARAQREVDSVLKSHPNSAKAHYVKAELSARQHDYSVVREELAIAERLAPGLPFVNKESLLALRKQIAMATAPGEAPDTRTMGAGPEGRTRGR